MITRSLSLSDFIFFFYPPKVMAVMVKLVKLLVTLIVLYLVQVSPFFTINVRFSRFKKLCVCVFFYLIKTSDNERCALQPVSNVAGNS